MKYYGLTKPPKSLRLGGNSLHGWRLWKQDFMLFFIATEYNDKPNEVKTSFGEETREVHNIFSFPSVTDSMKFDKVIEKFKAYFVPRKNIIYSHFKFIIFRQNIRQPFDNHLTRIKKLGNGCDYKKFRRFSFEKSDCSEKITLILTKL